jgi:hypothetical protein
MSLVIVVCCHVEVSTSVRSPVQGSSTDCGSHCVLPRNLNDEAALARVGLLRQNGRRSIRHKHKQYQEKHARFYKYLARRLI